MPRATWYTDHPPACTCEDCQQKRLVIQSHPGKIGRNEKCPCGSGAKYKKCHGK